MTYHDYNYSVLAHHLPHIRVQAEVLAAAAAAVEVSALAFHTVSIAIWGFSLSGAQ